MNKSMKKKVSIIIPVYNAENCVERCIKSVLQQTYELLEILIINDGSQDAGGEICKRYAEKDRRIKYVEKINGGLSDTRNVGIEYSTGDFLYFLDSDDYINQHTIEKMVEVAEKERCDLVCAGLKEVSFCDVYEYENDEWQPQFQIDNIRPFYLQIITNHGAGKLIRKSLADSVMFRYPIGRNYEDVSTTYLLFEKAERVAYTTECPYYYVQNAGSISHIYSRKNIYDLLQAYQEIDAFYRKKNNGDSYEYFYELTILFTLYSRLMMGEMKRKERMVLEQYIKKEFDRIWKEVKVFQFKQSPMWNKIWLYKYRLAKPLLLLRNIMRYFRRNKL